MTEKRPGPAPGVPLIEVSVKREWTVVRGGFLENSALTNFFPRDTREGFSPSESHVKFAQVGKYTQLNAGLLTLCLLGVLL